MAGTGVRVYQLEFINKFYYLIFVQQKIKTTQTDII